MKKDICKTISKYTIYSKEELYENLKITESLEAIINTSKSTLKKKPLYYKCKD